MTPRRRQSVPWRLPARAVLVCLVLCGLRSAEHVALAQGASRRVARPAPSTPNVAAPNARTPELSLSLRGVDDDVVEQGDPMIIAVRLEAPPAAVAPIALAPTSGSWVDAITVELLPDDGGAAVARATVVGNVTAPQATLSATRVAGGLWRIVPDATLRVMPGTYRVRARLAITSGRGWTGEVDSDERTVQVVTASDSSARVTQRTVLRARNALLDGRIQDAATILDARLTQAPDDVRVLTVRADVALRAGNPVAALVCLNRVRPASSGHLPDLEREELHDRVLATLRNETPPSPPSWSWPPASVMEPSAEAKATFQKGR